MKASCSFCVKVFSNKKSLQQHIWLIHSKVKNHNCDICGKGFQNVQSFRDHQNIHNNLRLHKCDICGAAYSCKRHFQTHQKLNCKITQHKKNIILKCPFKIKCIFTCFCDATLIAHLKEKHHTKVILNNFLKSIIEII